MSQSPSGDAGRTGGAATITATMTVERLLELHPRAARVFVDHRMACVGCPMAAFETVEEVAQVYGHDEARLLAALRACTSARADRWPGDDAPPRP